LEKLNEHGNEGLLDELLRHPVGQDFRAALADWVRRPGPAPGVFPELKPSLPRRCRASVIINSVDRAEDLRVTLNDLGEVWDSERDELIIVLGPTADDSEAVIRESGIPHQLLRCDERNLAISRNIGLNAASGEFIAFIDDDASPEPGWLDALLAPLQSDAGVAVTAGFVLDGRGKKMLNAHVIADTLGRAQSFSTPEDAAREIQRRGAHRAFTTATGCNMAFRREPLQRIGGFDPAYRYFLEETDVVRSLGLLGLRCEAAPRSLVRHRLGRNVARLPKLKTEDSLVIIRSQLHFVGKFGKSTSSAAEIEQSVWQRVLADLERIAWDGTGFKSSGVNVPSLQCAYLRALTDDLGLDSNPA
jgi:GT2 family glycosyltransferase